MKENTIYALGVGAATPVFCEIATACGYNIAGLYHYNNERNGEVVNGWRIIGSFDDLFKKDISGMNFLLTMGEPKIRYDLSERITEAGGILPTLKHPMSVISPNCTISSDGVIIGPMVIIQSNAKIDCGVVLSDMALVCHDADIEPYTFVGPKALVGAFVHISSFAFIGQAATLISKKAKHIGSHSIIGAGAVVTKAVEEYHVVAGQPAQTIKILNNETK